MSIDIQSGGDEAEGQDESDERLHDWYWSLSRGSSPVECDLSDGFFRIYRKLGVTYASTKIVSRLIQKRELVEISHASTKRLRRLTKNGYVD